MTTIGINLVFLNPARTGGAETYCRELVRALPLTDTAGFRFLLFAPQGGFPFNDDPRFQVVSCPVDPANQYRRIAWEQMRLPFLMERMGVDLAHFPYGTAPLAYDRPAVVTVHDTMRICLPHMVPWHERRYRELLERNSADRGMHFIGVSDHDLRILRRDMGLDPARTTAIHHGISDVFFDVGAVREPGSGSYLLWVGRPYEHKNLGTLLRAIAVLRRRGVTPPLLRLVGVGDVHRPRLRVLIDRLDVATWVAMEPPIPSDRLPSVYGGAMALCYPSRYESFGLPVVEAMACGTPVICSDIPVFDEIVGMNDAIRCGVDSPEQFADAIERVQHDTVIRASLSVRGRSSAARFRWHATADKTLAAYRTALTRR